MNYLCKYNGDGKYFVISKSMIELPIGVSISFGGNFFKVICEVEIR